MNYTENYHLPQWVETDRIMMEDFNAAMASIEGGLAAADRAGALADSMSRDVYRQIVQSRVFHGPGNQPRAMWINALASREDAGGEGHGWNGRYGVYHGNGGLPTMAGIKALGPKEEQQINTVASGGSKRAAVTFTSDGYGTLDEVKIWIQRGSDTTGSNAAATITMTRLDTGAVVARLEQVKQPTGNSVRYWHHLGFPVEAGVSYRLEYTLPNTGFYGYMGFSLATKHYTESDETLRFTAREAETVLTKTVTPPAWAAGAIAVLNWKGDGSAALAINGQALIPTRTAEGINAVGGACKETEIQLESIPAEPFQLTLTMEKGEGDLDIYDYGLIWR